MSETPETPVTEDSELIPLQRVTWEALRSSVETFATKPDDAQLAQKTANNLIDYALECVKSALDIPAGELVQVLRCGSVELVRLRFQNGENMTINEMIREDAREQYSAALLDFDAALDYFNNAVPPIVTKADMRSVWWQKSSIEERASASALWRAAHHLLISARGNLTDFGATILACDLVLTNMQLALHDPDSSDTAYNAAQDEFEDINEVLVEAYQRFLKSMDMPELRAQQSELLVEAFRQAYKKIIDLMRDRRLCTSRIVDTAANLCAAALQDDTLSQLTPDMIASNANTEHVARLAHSALSLAREFDRRQRDERDGQLLLRSVQTLELARRFVIEFLTFTIALFDALAPKGTEFIALQIAQRMSGANAQWNAAAPDPTSEG